MKTSETKRIRSIGIVFFAAIVLAASATGDAGEINLSKYIEPNQMSNLLTRHVRKGIIKRIGLDDDQLDSIRKAVDPHREALLVRLTEYKDARIEMMTAVASNPFDPERVRKTHQKAASAELGLSLVLGEIIREVRPIVSESQLEEVREMVDEVRAASEVRFEDFAESLATGELLKKRRSSQKPR